MQLTEFNEDIPEWLRKYMNTKCPYCTGHMADDGPPDKSTGIMKLTQRYCINPRCPGHMQHRIDILAKEFKIEGFGPATALQYIRSYKLENHLEILKFWFGDVKPKVHLWQVGSFAMIYGYSNAWKEMVKGIASFSEYFKNHLFIDSTIRANEQYLYYCEKFFDVKQPLSSDTINVMITGSIDRYSNRKDFIEDLNKTFGQYVQVVDIGKRIRNVSCLIKEEHAVDHEKTIKALDNGIPILTSKEFILKITQIVSNKFSEERGENLNGTENEDT